MADMKAVRFDHYGDIDVLEVRAVPRPSPGPGQVLVEVKAAGINPGEAMIRKGLVHNRWPATFPSGQGSDLAGVKAAGSADAADANVLADLAKLIAAGKLDVPIAAVFPLEEVQQAYRMLEQRHTRGKIVLRP